MRVALFSIYTPALRALGPSRTDCVHTEIWRIEKMAAKTYSRRDMVGKERRKERRKERISFFQRGESNELQAGERIKGKR